MKMFQWQAGDRISRVGLILLASILITSALTAQTLPSNSAETNCVEVTDADSALSPVDAAIADALIWLLNPDQDATNATDYYKGLAPCLDTIWIGTYLGIVSNHLVLPLVANAGSATGALTNAPLVFDAGKSAARFSASPRGVWSTSVTVRTAKNGQAVAWLFLPADFTLTNRLTVTAGRGNSAVQAQLAAWLYDHSGTGVVITNTDRVPMPLALTADLDWLNYDQLPHCEGAPSYAAYAGSGFAPPYLLTNLFLEPVALTNDFVLLTLHNTVTNTLYQLSWKLDLVTGTNWNPSEIITATNTNMDFSPFPAYGQQHVFFAAVTNADTTVRLDFVAGYPTDALEPDATNSDPGHPATLSVSRTGPNTNALPVFFNLTGSASFTNDYALTDTNGGFLTNVITILAGATNADFLVVPREDQLPEFNESVVVVLMTRGGYFVDPTNASRQVVIMDNPETNFFTNVAGVNAPVGIDYHPGSNALIVSGDFTPDGTNHFSFLRLGTNGSGALVTNEWSDVSGLGDEIKLAIVPTTAGGFTQGEMFFGNGTNGIVAKLSADGSTAELEWAVLSGTNGLATLLRGSLYVDQTGVFGNNLIVVTGDGAGHGGEVWQIGSTTNGMATNQMLLATLTNNANPHLEGVITLPDDPLKWGPWAAKIITGAESALDISSNVQPRIYTIATNGVVVTNLFGIAPEDFDLIPTNQNLYCAAFTGSKILKLSRTLLTNYWGDLLITQGGDSFGLPPPTLFITHWDSTNFLFYTTEISVPDILEHVSFAPIEVPP